MAKKSAKSKGFRRQNAKKPYLSKRDIALLCVLVAAVAIGAFFLFRYDDGALKVKNGAVVTGGDNWLIANGSNTRGGVRYYKLGEVGEIEGYTREATPMSSDANLTEYVFTPAEAAGLDRVTVATSHAGAEAMARYAASMFGGVDGVEVSELQTAEMNGQSAHYFTYTASPVEQAAEAEAPAEDAEAKAEGEAAEDAEAKAEGEAPAEDAEAKAEGEAPAEDAEANAEGEAPAEDAEAKAEGEAAEKAYRKVLYGYIDAAHECCISFHVEGSADTADALPTDEALLTALDRAVTCVTLEPVKK